MGFHMKRGKKSRKCIGVKARQTLHVQCRTAEKRHYLLITICGGSHQLATLLPEGISLIAMAGVLVVIAQREGEGAAWILDPQSSFQEVDRLGRLAGFVEARSDAEDRSLVCLERDRGPCIQIDNAIILLLLEVVVGEPPSGTLILRIPPQSVAEGFCRQFLFPAGQVGEPAIEV